MYISITARHAGIDDDVKNYARQKLEKLGQIWTGEATTNLIIDSEKSGFSVELNFHAGHSQINSHARNRVVRTAVDKAVRKTEKRLKKLKEKHEKRRKKQARLSPPPREIPDDIPRLIKVDEFIVKTLDEREASIHMRASNLNFLLYRGGESGKLSIIYRRQDGNLGLIELDE